MHNISKGQSRFQFDPWPHHHESSSRGPKHGRSERQIMFWKAKDMQRAAKNNKNGNHPTILSRRKADEEYQKSLGLIGIGEEEIRMYDQIALENHDNIATKAERTQCSNHCIMNNTVFSQARTCNVCLRFKNCSVIIVRMKTVQSSGQPCHLLVGLFNIFSLPVHHNTKHHLDSTTSSKTTLHTEHLFQNTYSRQAALKNRSRTPIPRVAGTRATPLPHFLSPTSLRHFLEVVWKTSINFTMCRENLENKSNKLQPFKT